MADTPNIRLTFLEANQAQKHITVNEAFRALDRVDHCRGAGKHEHQHTHGDLCGQRHCDRRGGGEHHCAGPWAWWSLT